MNTNKIHGTFAGVDIPLRIKLIKGSGKPNDIGGITHSHDFTEIIIIYGGTGIHTFNEEDYEVKSGNVFIVHGNHTHYIKERKDLRYAEIEYNSALSGIPYNLFSHLPGYKALFVLEPQQRINNSFRTYLELNQNKLEEIMRIVTSMFSEFNVRKTGYESMLIGKLIELIVYLSREYTSSDDRKDSSLFKVSKAISLLEYYYQKNWNLEKLCKVSNMSKSKFINEFKNATQVTPINYLIDIRVNHAKILLKTTKNSVTQIAFDVGFEDSNYFSRLFHKIVGKSPSAYRKSNSKK